MRVEVGKSRRVDLLQFKLKAKDLDNNSAHSVLEIRELAYITPLSS